MKNQGKHNKPKPPGNPRPRSQSPVRMTGAKAVVRSLEELGVTDVFGMPGGAIIPVYDQLMDTDQLNVIAVTSRALATQPRATQSPRAKLGAL